MPRVSKSSYRFQKEAKSCLRWLHCITIVRRLKEACWPLNVDLTLLARYWDNPEEFKPSRFMSKDWPRENLLSFSAGPRACLGRKWAFLEPFGACIDLSFSILDLQRQNSLRSLPRSCQSIESLSLKSHALYMKPWSRDENDSWSLIRGWARRECSPLPSYPTHMVGWYHWPFSAQAGFRLLWFDVDSSPFSFSL